MLPAQQPEVLRPASRAPREDPRAAPARRPRHPLSERQTLALREKVKALEGKLGELIQLRRGERRHQREGAPPGGGAGRRARLRGAGALAQLPPARGLRRAARGAAHLGQSRCRRASTPARRSTKAQMTHAATLGGPQCGLAAGNPCVPWFGEAAEHVRSVALVPLGQTRRRSACSPWAARTRSASSPTWGRCTFRRIGELCAAGGDGATLARRVPRGPEAASGDCRPRRCATMRMRFSLLAVSCKKIRP